MTEPLPLRADADSESPSVALVTGASRGIGREIALQLAAEGHAVVAVWARSESAARSLQEEVARRGGTCWSLRANLAAASGVQRVLDAVARIGALDLLVHNAAIGSFKPLLSTRPNQWDMTMSLNAHTLLELARGTSHYLARRSGSIVAITSLGGQRVIPNYGAIGVSKAALEALVRYLAVELGPSGVRVNAICAGWTDTDATRRMPGHAAIREALAQRIPLRRLGTREDIAAVVRLLTRTEASWITGQTIGADGGEGLL
jgi:enoyl-[acyl-carrier protein] reductase III